MYPQNVHPRINTKFWCWLLLWRFHFKNQTITRANLYCLLLVCDSFRFVIWLECNHASKATLSSPLCVRINSYIALALIQLRMKKCYCRLEGSCLPLLPLIVCRRCPRDVPYCQPLWTYLFVFRKRPAIQLTTEWGGSIQPLLTQKDQRITSSWQTH